MYEVSLNDVESLYADIIFYLKNGYAPSNLDYKKKRALRLKAKQYQLVNDVLFKLNYDSILLRCLEKSKAEKVLQMAKAFARCWLEHHLFPKHHLQRYKCMR